MGKSKGKKGGPSLKKCYYCDQIGHMKGECQVRAHDMAKAQREGRPFVDQAFNKSKGKTGVNAVGDGFGTTSSSYSTASTLPVPVPSQLNVGAVCFDTVEESVDRERFVFAITRPTTYVTVWMRFVVFLLARCVAPVVAVGAYASEQKVQYVLVDSGSAVTTCPSTYAPWMPIERGSVTALVGAGEGQSLQTFGFKRVSFVTEVGAKLEMNFEVTNVRFPIMSVFRLIEGGCTVHFEKGASYIEFPGSGREFLEVRGDTFWLRAWFEDNASGCIVCPVDGLPVAAGDMQEQKVAPKARRLPDEPSDKEVAEHALTHLPFRDWCRHCITGKAPDWPHRRVVRDPDEVPMIQVDFYFMNKKGDSDIVTLLNCVDCVSGAVCTCVCGKGPEVYVIEMVVNFLSFLGRAEIILRHDGKVAIKSLVRAIQQARSHETQDECTPRYSSSSLGVAESMNRVVEG